MELLKEHGITKDKAELVFCPKCGSLDHKTKSISVSIYKAISLIFQSLFMLKTVENLFQKTSYVCNICGNEFDSLA